MASSPTGWVVAREMSALERGCGMGPDIIYSALQGPRGSRFVSGAFERVAPSDSSSGMMMPLSSPMSLRELICSQSRFLKNPLFWKSRHLNLLGSGFEFEGERINIEPGASHGSDRDDSNTEADSYAEGSPGFEAKRLALSSVKSTKYSSVTKLLVGEGLPFRRRL